MEKKMTQEEVDQLRSLQKPLFDSRLGSNFKTRNKKEILNI